MKTILLALPLAAWVIALPTAMVSCADMSGDGIDSIVWTGSINPENASYRNPVWEPSLAGGTILKGSSRFVAISAETQWATGLTYHCPAIMSTDLSDWSFSQEAFNAPLISDSLASINSLSADFAKTVANANYWMFYGYGDNTIGAASASYAQGPYTDLGVFLTAEELGVTTLRDPFFLVASTNFYVCYTTEAGTYLQKVTIRRGRIPTTSGEPKLIAGPAFSDIALYRVSGSQVYLFGNVGDEVRYARADNINGPYLDKSGNDVATGSQGEPFIAGTEQYVHPENVQRLFPSSTEGLLYVAFNATRADKPSLGSGFARKPLFINPVRLGEDGWFSEVSHPVEGWTSPLYEL